MSAPTGCSCILHSLSKRQPLIRVKCERCLTCELVDKHENRACYDLLVSTDKDDIGTFVVRDNMEVEAMAYGRLH